MTDTMSFARILEPGQIGKIRTKNRIIKTCGGAEDIGSINRAFLEAIAKGGAGLIIWGDIAVEYPRGLTIPISHRHLVDDVLVVVELPFESSGGSGGMRRLRLCRVYAAPTLSPWDSRIFRALISKFFA